MPRRFIAQPGLFQLKKKNQNQGNIQEHYQGLDLSQGVLHWVSQSLGKISGLQKCFFELRQEELYDTGLWIIPLN